MTTVHFSSAAVMTMMTLCPCVVRGQLVETNVALGKPTAGDVAFGYPTSNGNDGDIGTFNHADNLNAPPANPYWEVDLGGSFDLTKVEIVDRLGCCDPNRLNGSEIRLFDQNGAQIGSQLLVDGLPPASPDLATGTKSFDNGGSGWTGVARIRVDGYTQYFQFTELRAFSLQPPAPVNVARFGIASASGEVWPGMVPGNLIDGSVTTLSHPLGGFGETLGFTYTVDLLESHTFERLELLNRVGCCPERLTNFRVSLHGADGTGAMGPAVWSADLRTGGDNSGDSGTDTVTADLDADGTFAGRFITVENLSNDAYNPQIAELRALTFDPLPENLAAGKLVGCYDASGNPVATWTGFPGSFLTDGSLFTISHPFDQFSAGYYFELDLGEERQISEVRVSGRLDCCPERFENPSVAIVDGTSNTVFFKELLGQVTTPVRVSTGTVMGRYVRVINANGADYGPQLSELAVYGPATPVPDAGDFRITAATVDAATQSGSVTFTSEAGAVYRIEGSGDLKTWAPVKTGVASDGDVTTESFTDPALQGATERYYRVVLP